MKSYLSWPREKVPNWLLKWQERMKLLGLEDEEKKTNSYKIAISFGDFPLKPFLSRLFLPSRMSQSVPSKEPLAICPFSSRNSRKSIGISNLCAVCVGDNWGNGIRQDKERGEKDKDIPLGLKDYHLKEVPETAKNLHTRVGQIQFRYMTLCNEYRKNERMF